jgi:hypothetical protein
VEDVHYGEVGPDHLLELIMKLLPFMVPFGPTRVVFSGLYPCKVDY